MLYGCCVNLLPKTLDRIGLEYAGRLKRLGYDYIELPLNELAQLSEQEFRDARTVLEELDLPCRACNDFMPARFQITGSDVTSRAELTDYLRREELCLANAVPTAEGAIRIAMEETARTLHGASALVVGYGRIGMALAPRLRALGMQTEICARRCETRALAQMQGFSAVPVSALAQSAAAADVIFNTVPVLLLSETVLKALPPETLVIDLASRPGGTDFDAAKRLGIRVVWALALPPEVRRCHIPEKAVSAEFHRKNVEKSVESVLNSEKRLRNCEKATKTGIISSKEF